MVGRKAMLEQMTKDGWRPVVLLLELNSDEKALLARAVDEKIAKDDDFLPLYIGLKRKIDALTF
jgi:hypothetical protein